MYVVKIIGRLTPGKDEVNFCPILQQRNGTILNPKIRGLKNYAISLSFWVYIYIKIRKLEKIYFRSVILREKIKGEKVTDPDLRF